ncbi:hypothetical protein P153DRAFT_395792 [Dothidotthia symphoricarpi CBS 119687]|uniref:Uncharacterized protein n=1 Tax=Dothidotthia symphoricarpi CBS 119687 TaxID=1392245 RepID=A0A6A6AEY5_9PLEO|nr:uncharacterized protein P153DRAFT_395792 [Dothidotthia symphoricarpi CBS 119687]KAF2130370.1 hypothetical protein P153DRAFT_395792 [Dothidotthia symphoricarpi CBS 119687]
MQDAMPGKIYKTQFKDAQKAFEEDKFELAIAKAKYNLTDYTLPPYYYMENCMLIVAALDDWDDANDWLGAAEYSYLTTLDEATRKNDTDSLKLLVYLRSKLDQFKDFRMQDLMGMTIAESYGYQEDDMEAAEEALAELELGETSEMDLEDTVALARAEEEIGTVDHYSLHENTAADTTQFPTLNIVPPAEGDQTPTIANAAGTTRTYRNKSSKRSKGGAFHAQQFSKSRPAAEPRASILSFDWTPNASEHK